MKPNDRILLKKIGDVPVFITGDGKFEAEVNGKVIQRTTLAATEKELNRTNSPIKAVSVSEGDVIASFRVVNLVKPHKNGNAIDDKGVQVNYFHLRVYDEAVVVEILELQRQCKELEKRAYQLVGKLPRFKVQTGFSRT